MKTEQASWTNKTGWDFPDNSINTKAQFVLVFGNKSALKDTSSLKELSSQYPKATLLGCSTAGEIYDTQVNDNTIVATAVYLEKTPFKFTSAPIDRKGSREAGKHIAENLLSEDLTHVLVFSEGLNVNGSELVSGLRENLPDSIGISGGLAGDGANFIETGVIQNGELCTNTTVAMGLYGKHIKVTSASLGGWDSFGPIRKITKATDNILYELDGKSALELYKSYLCEHAANLPASGLLFPLSITDDNSIEENGLVRTILAVNEEDQSITFAGDMPLGWHARLMKANFDRLVSGAIDAANIIKDSLHSNTELAILISCVGRKMVLGQRIEEEVEGVRDVLGENATITGFYSYGEISPFTPNAQCKLHNQTMTITAISEELS